MTCFECWHGMVVGLWKLIRNRSVFVRSDASVRTPV